MNLSKLNPAKGAKKAIRGGGEALVQAWVKLPVAVIKVNYQVPVIKENGALKAARCRFIVVFPSEDLIINSELNLVKLILINWINFL